MGNIFKKAGRLPLDLGKMVVKWFYKLEEDSESPEQVKKLL